ncbi:MAG: 1,4-dihydroxy-2-naphthoate polyprenyltransferase [Polyangiaceae bacterium]
MSAGVADAPRGRLAIWLAAIRPATLTAALGPVAVGSGLALASRRFAPLIAGAALLGAVLIQIGTNLYNDYADFKKGADTEARVGPARAVQRGWLTARQVKLAAYLSFFLAAVVGLYLVAKAGVVLLAIGIASLICGVAYTGGPAPLAYTGLGDLFVMLFFGGAAVCGTYYAQVGSVHLAAVTASLAVGALATAILVVNNLRDRHTDAEAGKRTLVVRFGERFGRLEYSACLVLAYGAVAGMAVVPLLRGDTFAPGWLLPWLTLPLAWREHGAVQAADGPALNPRLGGTARLGLLFSLLLAVGVAL